MGDLGFLTQTDDGFISFSVTEHRIELVVIDPTETANIEHKLVVVDGVVPSDGLSEEDFKANINKIMDKGRLLDAIVTVAKTLKPAGEVESFLNGVSGVPVVTAKSTPKKTVEEVVGYDPGGDDTLIQSPKTT